MRILEHLRIPDHDERAGIARIFVGIIPFRFVTRRRERALDQQRQGLGRIEIIAVVEYVII